MTPSPQSSYNECLKRSADQHQLQMWRAAQTVRAHVTAENGLDSMLDCLGLAEVQRPAGA